MRNIPTLIDGLCDPNAFVPHSLLTGKSHPVNKEVAVTVAVAAAGGGAGRAGGGGGAGAVAVALLGRNFQLYLTIHVIAK